MANIVDYNFQLLSLDESHRRQGSKKLLQPGRVVVLCDGVRGCFTEYEFSSSLTLTL